MPTSSSLVESLGIYQTDGDYSSIPIMMSILWNAVSHGPWVVAFYLIGMGKFLSISPIFDPQVIYALILIAV